RLDMIGSILADYRLRIQNKIFTPLSDKQIALIEQALAEESTYAQQQLAERESEDEKSLQSREHREIAEIARTFKADFDYADHFQDAAFCPARKSARGEMTRFEAKEYIEMRRQAHDRSAAEIDLFGMTYGEYQYLHYPMPLSWRLEQGAI